MRIDFVEIANFRKLLSTRVSFSADKTVFVGANNSGKTSAMVALRTFLIARERDSFALNDFTLSHWSTLVSMGQSWECAREAKEKLPTPEWEAVLPFLDVWLHVEDDEARYVQKILPTLDWEGGRLGVRLQLQPKNSEALQEEYLVARAETWIIQAAIPVSKADSINAEPLTEDFSVALWPQTLTEFLKRRLPRMFEVKGYVLDPAKLQNPEHGRARPQALIMGAEPVEGDPLKGLIRVHEISAQRDLIEGGGADDDDDDASGSGASKTRKLTDQLRRYYNKHLDPYEKPDAQDLQALQAIELAQKAFDKRLLEGFDAALKEMEALGYPGITNPKLSISTRLRPVEGLNHDAAVRYLVPFKSAGETSDLFLPEESNGLGYQNLISMVFRLMSFRDSWMRVGKAQTRSAEGADQFTPPLHLVLVEEPEAHLHTQVQQAFIRRAYDVLCNHPDLMKKDSGLSTQLVVSTHSSHVAHECNFSSLRYFRRLPAQDGEVPTSCVVNLTSVFGEETDTKRFVTRYLKITHCDLFFADAAVLIEGPAERILVPNFVRTQSEFQRLSECYVTWLEIGGSHAHRLKELIEHLGLTTLIITDLDATDKDHRKIVPARISGCLSRNATLKSWVPGTSDLQELLDKTSEEKIKQHSGERFSLRVAYQCPVKITFKGVESEALANTLEDALVFENIDLFSTLSGSGLIAKFRTAISESANVADLAQKLAEQLKGGDKAELAMDLLELKDPSALKPPTYIREGLLWLSDQLQKDQSELGLPAAIIIEPAVAQEAAE